MTANRQAWTALVVVASLVLLVYGFYGTIIYIVIHFVRKLW